ncbi:hypothetical protein IAD21_05263 [Abditibacteriota bacterium]|nr:hypothetical protein IAD21_05263 [Abditibacteriota bacterium]
MKSSPVSPKTLARIHELGIMHTPHLYENKPEVHCSILQIYMAASVIFPLEKVLRPVQLLVH